MSDKLCSAPWTHFAVGNHPNGNIISPCCRFNFKGSRYNPYKFLPVQEAVVNENYFSDIRQRMLNGEQLNECSKCWAEENNDVLSMRQKLNKEFTIDNTETFSPKYLEIMFSNLCNLACRMCDITQSSSWAVLYNKAFVPNGIIDHTVVPEEFIENNKAKTDIMKFDMSQISSLDLSEVKKVKILGGEPMMAPEHESFLIDLLSQVKDAKQLTLVYHTNCTKIPNDKILDIWRTVGSIEISFSIDGYKEVNEYQRTNSDWQTVEQTMKWFIDLDIDLVMNVHSVISNITIWSFDKLINWTTKFLGNNSNTFDFVQNPNYLSLCNLPDQLKLHCRNTVNTWNLPQNRKNFILDYLFSKPYNNKLWHEFINKMNIIDDVVGKSLIETVPQLKGFTNDA